MNKNKVTIKESISRIIFILSILNLFLIFPFSIELFAINEIFKSDINNNSYINNIFLIAIYFILSIIIFIIFFKERKNKGINLIKNISTILIIISILVIIYGIVLIIL